MPLWVYDETGKLVTSQGAFEFTLTADSGTNQTVNNGETVDIAGGVGINSVVGATNTVTLDSVWDYSSVLGSSGSFDVNLLTDVTGYDSNVLSIEICYGVRSTVSATSDIMRFIFNNDPTNYHYQRAGGGAGATLAGATTGSDLSGAICAANSPTNSFTIGRVFIDFPYSTNYHKVIYHGDVGRYDTTTYRTDLTGMIWANTSAITRIQVRTDNHPTDLLATNSFLRIRLIK